MNQDYDKIRLLFENSVPELGSDDVFIHRIGKVLDGVDIVKEARVSTLRRNRQTALLAAILGFVCGIFLTILFPIFKNIFDEFFIRFIELADIREIVSVVVSWAMISAGGATAAIVSYVFLTRVSTHAPTLRLFKI